LYFAFCILSDFSLYKALFPRLAWLLGLTDILTEALFATSRLQHSMWVCCTGTTFIQAFVSAFAVSGYIIDYIILSTLGRIDGIDRAIQSVLFIIELHSPALISSVQTSIFGRSVNNFGV